MGRRRSVKVSLSRRLGKRRPRVCPRVDLLTVAREILRMRANLRGSPGEAILQ